MKILIEPGLVGVPIWIMGNKQDKEGAMTPEEVFADFDQRKDIAYHGCSAISGDGVWESVAKLADLMDMTVQPGEK